MRHERMNGLDQGEGSRTTSGLDADNDDSLPSTDDKWYKDRSGN